MRTKSIIAAVVLLAATAAHARTPRPSRHSTRHRIDVGALRAAIAARAANGRDVAVLDRDVPAAPMPAPALSAVLPPGVVAALVAAVERSRGRPSATDGLAWRDLRPKDESGRRIVPLAIGRF